MLSLGVRSPWCEPKAFLKSCQETVVFFTPPSAKQIKEFHIHTLNLYSKFHCLNFREFDSYLVQSFAIKSAFKLDF